MTQSRSLPAGATWMRARMILLLADGIVYQRSRICWTPLRRRLCVGNVGSCNIGSPVLIGGVASRPAAVGADPEVAGEGAVCD